MIVVGYQLIILDSRLIYYINDDGRFRNESVDWGLIMALFHISEIIQFSLYLFDEFGIALLMQNLLSFFQVVLRLAHIIVFKMDCPKNFHCLPHLHTILPIDFLFDFLDLFELVNSFSEFLSFQVRHCNISFSFE